MAAERFARRVAEKIGVKYGLEVVRGYMLKRIEEATPDSLYLAIKDGTGVWSVASPTDKRKGRQWARKFRKHKHKLTPEIVLRWLSEDRPDLASLIVNMPDKEGAKWLGKEVKDLKPKLWPE